MKAPKYRSLSCDGSGGGIIMTGFGIVLVSLVVLKRVWEEGKFEGV